MPENQASGIIQGRIYEFHSADDNHEVLISAANEAEAKMLMEFIDPKQPYKLEEVWGRQIWLRR
jgi:hypothetical protein